MDLMDLDSEIEFVEKDSGMSSLGGSKDETPERRAITVGHNILKINKRFLWQATNQIQIILFVMLQETEHNDDGETGECYDDVS